MGDDLSSGTGVHAWKTKVGTDIGVVKIDSGSTSEVGNVFVVNTSTGNGGDGGGTEGGGGTKEGTTVGLSVEGGLGRGLGVRRERGGGAKTGKRGDYG